MQVVATHPIIHTTVESQLSGPCSLGSSIIQICRKNDWKEDCEIKVGGNKHWAGTLTQAAC